MLNRLVLIAAAFAVPAFSQFDFKVDGRDVQVHSFASQGFLYSNENNYLSMPTSKGSFALTDGGVNVTTQITDKFRAGGQMYLRNVGEFGNWVPVLDWGLGDYKFATWFGFRAGRVKTTLGLYNDIQDMDSLHTFALLPESIYPIDWRSTLIAHDGGDVYGSHSVKHLGTFSYTGYAGMRPQDPTSGYIVAAKAVNVFYDSLGGRQTGGDIRWTMPFGAVAGASYLTEDITGIGTIRTGTVSTPYHQNTNTDELAQYYLQVPVKGFRVDFEYRRNIRDISLYRTAVPTYSIVDSRGWYIAGAYRINKNWELGAYRSIYWVDTRKNTDPAAQHLFETVIAGRYDFANHYYLKVEGHFVDGAPTTPSAARAFYTVSNPNGILPTTSLLVMRTGFSF